MADPGAGKKMASTLQTALAEQLPEYLLKQRWFGGKARPSHAAVDWLRKRLASPSGVGPFPLNWLAERPDIAHAMPNEVRTRFNARCLRPGAAAWLRPRFDGVRVLAGERVHSAVVAGERIALMLDHGTAVFDHVLLGTGYNIDVARLGILDAGLLAAVTAMGHLPDLGANRAVGWFGTSPHPVLRRVTTAARPQDTLLRDGEVQYVCRYAARQSHGRPIRRPRPPSLASQGRLEHARKRNDIMFRRVRAVL